MDYKLLITKALEQENWDKVIEYATEAKNGTVSFLGIRKGVLNLFEKNYYCQLKDSLEELGFKVHEAYHKSDVDDLIRNKELNLDIINETPVVLFAERSTAIARITKLYPIQLFNITQKTKKIKRKKEIVDEEIYLTINNKLNNQSISFKFDFSKELDKGFFKAYMREKSIDSILSDL